MRRPSEERIKKKIKNRNDNLGKPWDEMARGQKPREREESLVEYLKEELSAEEVEFEFTTGTQCDVVVRQQPLELSRWRIRPRIEILRSLGDLMRSLESKWMSSTLL